MYSLIIYDDYELLTVDEVIVTVPLFFAASTAMDFLRRLQKPWKSGTEEEGVSLCPFKKENDFQDQLLVQPVAGEQDKQSEDEPPQDHISQGWSWPRIGDIELTITFDYDGADKPYKMPRELARNRASRPFFHTDAELVSLRTAVDNWLVPRVGARRPHTYLKPSQQMLVNSVQIPDDPDIHKRLAIIQGEYGFEAVDDQFRSLWLHTYMEGTFRHRTRSVSGEIIITTDGRGRKQQGRLYQSESFLALAWIEILWALEHDMYARICENCGAVFRIGGPYTRKAYLCSHACRLVHRTEKMGGPDKMREYNRLHQQISRQRHRRG